MDDTLIKHGKILIIDDEKANIRFLEIILQAAGYLNTYSTTDSREARALFCQIQPDLVLLDLAMPHLDGFEVMHLLQHEMAVDDDMACNPVPILVLTADVMTATKHKALGKGARDFLSKPLDDIEVLLRIRNLLETRFRSVLLEARVRERTQDLEQAQLETLQRLALAAEYRDDDTGQHTRRVGTTAGLLAKSMGWPAAQVELLLRAAPLHDVGKIGIADSILLKPSRLTTDEFVTMQQHTVIGAGMLSGSSSPWLNMAEEIALSHHERWDGQGYPNRLVGDAIPMVGRIVAVADVFDALTHERPYKTAWPAADAAAEIEAQSGKQFDERVTQAFMTLPHESLI
jgi:putative two-component system response regulator